MAPSRTQRWLDLLAFLIGNRYPVSFEQIMEAVPAYRERWVEGDDTARASVRRMFERDKDGLRRLGIPLVTGRYPVAGNKEADGYLIPRGDFYLPYLELVDELVGPQAQRRARAPGDAHGVDRVPVAEADVRAAVLALRAVLSLPSFPFHPEARTALRKLTFDLDPAGLEPGSIQGEDDEMTAGEGGGPVRILDRPGGADPEGALGVLLDALWDRRRVGFRYRSMGRDAAKEREVEPWGLLFQWGSWYLVARDARQGSDETDTGHDVRLFRVDRMQGAKSLGAGTSRPEFEVPEDFRIRDYAGRKAWELGSGEREAVTALVRFEPSAALLAARNGWGDLEDEEADGGAVRSFSIRRLDPFVRWVLSFAGEARILAPSGAVEQMNASLQEIVSLHRGEGTEWTGEEG